MLNCKVVAFLLFVDIFKVQANDASDSNLKPLIEVFNPKGLRMSIPHISGIRFVQFHFNINVEVPPSMNTYRKELHHAVDRRWTWDEPNIKFMIGDTIYYITYVLVGAIGYRREGSFLITDIPTSNAETHTIYSSSTSEEEQQPSTYSPETTTSIKSPLYEQLFINCTQNLITQQYEMDRLRKTNEQLIAFVEKYPDAKKLTISGRIPFDPVDFIIRERLGINPSIVSVTRKRADSIVFEVATLVEKLEILEKAKEKLTGSDMNIS